MTKWRRMVGIGCGFASLFALAACGTSQKSSEPEQSSLNYDFTPADISNYPELQVGDSFRFDSPDVVWRVTAVTGETITMVSDTGARQVRPANPLLPNVEWSNKTHGKGKRLITNIRGDLFPLKVGNKIAFRSTVDTDKPPYAWEYDWSCEVVSQQVVTVPAGDFDTFKVDCARREFEKISIYYAPSVGYAVRFDNSNPQSGAVNSNMLVGYQRGDRVVGQIVPSKMDEVPAMASKDDDVSAEAPMAPPVKKEPADVVMTPDPKITTPAPAPMAKPMEKQAMVNSGAVMLHLASYKREANLEPSWTRLQNRYRTELGGLGHVGKSVSIPGKGDFTRLLAGPLDSRAQAAGLCRQLKAKGQYCAVMSY